MPITHLKLQSLKFRKMVIAVVNTDQMARIWLNEEQTQVAVNIATRVKQALNLPNNSATYLVPLEFNFSTAENFDMVDVGNVNGDERNTVYTTKSIRIPPRIRFSNQDFGNWSGNVFSSIRQALNEGGAGSMAVYIGTRKANVIKLPLFSYLNTCHHKLPKIKKRRFYSIY